MKEPTIFVNLIGEEYEPQIPGTKCPVSAGRLREMHWTQRQALWRIHIWIQDQFYLLFEREELLEWFHVADVRVWSHEKDTVRVNALRNTKCPLTAIELWDMYVLGKQSQSVIASQVGRSQKGIDFWMKKAGIPSRDTASSNKIFSRTKEYKEKQSRIMRQILNSPEMLQKFKSNQKIATLKAAEKNAKHFTAQCPECCTHFKCKPSQFNRGVNTFCSRSCRAKFYNAQRTPDTQRKMSETCSIKAAIVGLICPRCKEMRIVLGGKIGGCQRFRCSACRYNLMRPIIDLGLRKDLEAAGALDDGRILASVFAKEGEAS